MASSGEHSGHEKHSPLDQFEINPLVNFEVGGVDLEKAVQIKENE